MENIQSTLYGKMWPGLFQAIKEKISAGSWKKSQKATFQCLKVENGQMPEWLELREQGGRFSVPHGGCLMLNFGECPNVENVSILSAILEADVPDKYFLSAKACWGIIRRAQEKQKEIPTILKIALLERIAEEWQRNQADRIYINATKSVTLMGRAGGGGGKTGLYLLPVYTIAGNVIGRKSSNGGNQTGINKDVAPTLTGADRHAIAYAQSGFAEWKEGVGTLKRSRGAAGGGSETLAVIMERIARVVKYRVRRLTPLECERLDGFPDYWTRYGASGKEMSDNARYMALGNSIAVPCAERVFIGIKKAESEE